MFLFVSLGTGFELPPVAANALNMAPPPVSTLPPGVPGGVPPGAPVPPAAPAAQQAPAQGGGVAPPIATQCFMLSNMFDPVT